MFWSVWEDEAAARQPSSVSIAALNEDRENPFVDAILKVQMSCAVELPNEIEADLNDPDVIEDAHRVSIGAIDLEQGIPTFDASDVDHHLERTRSERLVWKSVIIFASYNPLPLLRLALVRAHTQDKADSTSVFVRKRLTAKDIAQFKETAPWDLESFASTDNGVQCASTRRDRLVAYLPSSIQREFRQRVLQVLLLYVGAIAVVISISLLCMPWGPLQVLIDQSPYLFPVAKAAVASVAILSLWLVYALRFDSPVNYAALGFLTASETACAVAYAVSNGPHVVVQAISLLLSGILLLRAFSTRAVSVDDDSELLCPAQAALRSIVVLFAVSVPLSLCMGEAETHTSTISLLILLGLTALGLLWTALVLAVLEQTMTPDEYASALVFFQSDLVVLAVVEPGHVVLKQFQRFGRLLARKSEKALSHSPRAHQNVVVPAFWPERQQDGDATRPAAVTSHVSLDHETLSYPAHLTPRRSRAYSRTEGKEATNDATTSPVTSCVGVETSLNHATGARRRNSTDDD